MADAVFPDSVEPEHYPNTMVFSNHLNISSSKKLRNKEAGFTAIRSIELFQNFNISLIAKKVTLVREEKGGRGANIYRNKKGSGAKFIGVMT
ncbi:MAG: hypothetical protein COB30_015240 [Ectothiorhodospiraceae bacterium]|nr:hypothetical protein [Ectothiorhodospiraceae bacterium]